MDPETGTVHVEAAGVLMNTKLMLKTNEEKSYLASEVRP